MNTNKLTSNLLKHPTHLLFALLALLAVLVLPACGGLKEMRVTESDQPEGGMAGETPTSEQKASIVHVNFSDRLATMRNGRTFKKGDFLIVQNREGQQTGILKARASRPVGLQTADVLEGTPKINNTVTQASDSEADRLAETYRDPEE